MKIDREGRETNCVQTDKQTNRQTERQNDRTTDRHTDRITCRGGSLTKIPLIFSLKKGKYIHFVGGSDLFKENNSLGVGIEQGKGLGAKGGVEWGEGWKRAGKGLGT